MRKMPGRGSARCAVIIVIGLVVFSGGCWSSYSAHREAVRAALNGDINPDDTSRYVFDCPWEGCTDLAWLRGLPPASSVDECKSAGFFGACCSVYFPDGMHAEIHAYRKSRGRWRISFASHLLCPDPDHPDDPQGVVCDYERLAAMR